MFFAGRSGAAAGFNMGLEGPVAQSFFADADLRGHVSTGGLDRLATALAGQCIGHWTVLDFRGVLLV